MTSMKSLRDPAHLLWLLQQPKIADYVIPDNAEPIDRVVESAMRGHVLGIYSQGKLAGAFSFSEVNQAVYEIHTSLLPCCQDKLEAARSAILWLFANTMAIRVVTRVPVFNLAAKRFAVKAGMRFEYCRTEAFLWRGIAYDVEFMAFGIHEWIWHHADFFAQYGRTFHSAIHAINQDHGLPDHPDEHCHDVMVGVAIALLQAGNARRGIALYNEWAVVNGYVPVELLSDHPDSVLISMAGLKVMVGRDGHVSVGG